ncbi:MAG: DUF3141 domain-containing protein [Desulfosarcinaceae bacterium]|nr:DUF3141 domain-containing protein [Desulfosarcinaceae bacterium]
MKQTSAAPGKRPTRMPLITDAIDYWIDRSQRHILFWDVLRRRGNAYADHLKAGQPPVLVFDYEMVMDGRTFAEPVNYSLLRILDRRQHRSKAEAGRAQERRATRHGKAVDANGRPSRPIVVIDPRAGHGPGIGGFKLNSQIGEALAYGHPVYFIVFYTDPEPGQTIARIQAAEVRFLETVAERHPEAPKPAIIGNCQAGWATALIGADRPDVTGPMVLNGSPLSYWGGVAGANPMRYKGGLLGGVWLASLWSDLGAGHFDGAHLVAGFEDLNPANTYWKKYHHLFANVDTEADRFLDFEKWWGGFFKMTTEEIHFIVDSLFIGNELEQGRLRLGDDKSVNLKNFRDPILVFASGGDNITPPPQALNWIYKVYGSVDEIKRCGQVIIYMVHETIGHLGIFVSGKVAQKEHHQILGNLGWLEYLTPGLYEMVIEKPATAAGRDDVVVRFEARDMGDLLTLDDGLADEDAFLPVSSVSRFNDYCYRHLVSPWIQLAVTPAMAAVLRSLHPLRMQRYLISDANPVCWPLGWAAKVVENHRRPLPADNPWTTWEGLYSQAVTSGWDLCRDLRDLGQEILFNTVYDNPWLKLIFGSAGANSAGAAVPDAAVTAEANRLPARRRADKGGYAEACVRAMLAVVNADLSTDTRELKIAERLIQKDPRLRAIPPDRVKVFIKQEARLLEADTRRAIAGLARMVTGPAERQQVWALAHAVATAVGTPNAAERTILTAIAKVLDIAPAADGDSVNAPEPSSLPEGGAS